MFDVNGKKLVRNGVYRVIYKESGGYDTFSGRYILEEEWLSNMLERGEATAQRVG